LPKPFLILETAKILSINPLYPPILGDFLRLGDTPRPPAGCILHLFFSGLLENVDIVMINFLYPPNLRGQLKMGDTPHPRL
jgi:hypothetical protein